MCIRDSSLPDYWTEAETLKHCNLAETKSWRWRSTILVSNCIYWWNMDWDFEPKLKAQSNEWRGSASPWPKNFDKLHQRSNKWLSLLMITMESSWQVEYHVEQVPQQCITCLLAKAVQKMYKNQLQMLEAGPLLLHDNARLHIGNVVNNKLCECLSLIHI